MVDEPFTSIPLAEEGRPRRRPLISVRVVGPSGQPPRRAFRRLFLLGLPLLALAAVAFGTGYAYGPAPKTSPASRLRLPDGAAAQKKLLAKLSSQNRQLAVALERERPKGVYVVVDQTQNRLYLMRDEEVLLKAVCSAGSGYVLKEAVGGKRQWVFDTPRGLFRVHNKLENPVWKKPDWAFVEEGKPMPRDPSERIEYGVLGEYALYLEDGYMIHGTLYERLLGRPVTHGCIRLGREDLRVVWKNVPPSTPVFIF